MITDFPTSYVYFSFAFTRCRLSVYTEHIKFVTKLLENAQGVGLYTPEEEETFEEVDTRLMFELLARSLSGIIRAIFIPSPQEATQEIKARLGIPAD